jgi:hypothetical protein
MIVSAAVSFIPTKCQFELPAPAAQPTVGRLPQEWVVEPGAVANTIGFVLDAPPGDQAHGIAARFPTGLSSAIPVPAPRYRGKHAVLEHGKPRAYSNS